MMNPDDLKKVDLGEIQRRLDSLENRVLLLESNRESFKQKKAVDKSETEEEEEDFVDINFSLNAPFETKLGEYGLAWLGNIVLFFAIIFLWQYFNNAGKPLISLIVGSLSVVAVFGMSHFFRKGFAYLAFMFNLCGYIILYYVILRLHFYSDKPLIINEGVVILLLLALVAIQLYFAVKKHSQVLTGIAFTFAMITAFVTNSDLAFFLISAATSGLIIYLFWKHSWWKSLIIIQWISYIIFVIWMLKNPLSLAKTPADLTYHYAFICFSVITAMYSLLVFKKPATSFPENFVLTTILSAGFWYSILMLLLVFMQFPNAFLPFFIAISCYCVIYSIILKFYSPSKLSPALYVLFGFVSLSVVIYGIFHFPDSFLLLIYQSFLVLAFALWFRSHILTLMNTFLMLILMIIYYSTSASIHAVNFSIPFVAFLSARIINWQKERLNIKTNFIRNIYLFVLFFSLLYATYALLPKHYITLSWLIIGGIYFGLSIVLKNIKYRWMAMANILVSAFYLFLVDLVNIDLIYRILASLAFAIVSIVISTYYVKKLKKNEMGAANEQDGAID